MNFGIRGKSSMHARSNSPTHTYTTNHPHSRNKKPNLLPHIPRPPLRPKPLRRIQRRLPRQNIRLLTPHPPRPPPHLPKNIKRAIHHNPHITRKKPALIEFPRLARKSPKAVEKRNDGEIDQGEVCGIGLEWGFKDEGVARDALGAEGGVETDVGDGDGDPG